MSAAEHDASEAERIAANARRELGLGDNNSSQGRGSGGSSSGKTSTQSKTSQVNKWVYLMDYSIIMLVCFNPIPYQIGLNYNGQNIVRKIGHCRA